MRVSDSAVFMFFWSAALPLLASLGLAGGSCHCRFLCWSFLLEISWFGQGTWFFQSEMVWVVSVY